MHVLTCMCNFPTLRTAQHYLVPNKLIWITIPSNCSLLKYFTSGPLNSSFKTFLYAPNPASPHSVRKHSNPSHSGNFINIFNSDIPQIHGLVSFIYGSYTAYSSKSFAFFYRLKKKKKIVLVLWENQAIISNKESPKILIWNTQNLSYHWPLKQWQK